MRIEYENGHYVGDVDYNEAEHGYGTYFWDDGDKYVGNWVHGKRHGSGKYTCSEGAWYDGEWEYDVRSGQGTMHYLDGTYTGEWKNDKRHGRGKYTWPDGTWYDGEWEYDVRSGHGTMRYLDGTYTGEWHRDERNGKGMFRSSEGWSYDGQWKSDKMHGRGKCTFPDGDWYEGEWEYDGRSGHGTMHYRGGAKYIGMFKNHQICGHGILYERDGSSYEGDWSGYNNATNVIYKHGRHFDRGKIVNGEFILELQQWSTDQSSYCAAIHPNNNTVEHGSYHRNDRSSRGALDHIHFNDGSEVLIEDLGDKFKLTMRKNGVERVEYTPKPSHNPNYVELTKRVFKI